MKNITTTATLILSIPDGLTDQQAFNLLNKDVNPYGVDFIFPAYPGSDKPVVMARILKLDSPPKEVL